MQKDASTKMNNPEKNMTLKKVQAMPPSAKLHRDHEPPNGWREMSEALASARGKRGQR